MAEFIPEGISGAASKALNWKLLLTVLIITIIVVWIMGKISRQEVVLYDDNGNITGQGEVKRIPAWKFQKTAA